MNVQCCEHWSIFIVDWVLSILAGNKDSYKSLDGFKIQQDRTWVYGVGCPLASEFFFHMLIMGVML